MVGLSDLLNRKPSQLSGGQRQRVALARSIVSRRPVCLMDEPLSNLDAKLRAEMRDEIRALQQKLGLTMVYVTHDQVEAMTMADQVVLLQQGRVEQICPPEGFIGVRPEDVRVGTRGLPVRIAAVDYLGAETVVRLRYGDQPLFAKIDGRHAYTSGETLYISWEEGAVQCFGADGICIDAAQNAASE
jgi:sn-glycerol 3-phosphate transport system ATP-binding protein